MSSILAGDTIFYCFSGKPILSALKKMSEHRYTAIIATVSNAFCDVLLDYAVNKYSYYKVLLITSCIAFTGQILIGFFYRISCSLSALPYVVLHAVLILGGYICFVKALRYIPIALVGLIEASSLFLTFAIDSVLGYVQISFYFVLMLSLFVFFDCRNFRSDLLCI